MKLRRKGAKNDEAEISLPPVASPVGDDTWLSSGLDIENRIIDLTGVVSEPMLSVVLRSLVRLNTINNNPITIYLSSAGGTLLDGFAIYDLIRASPSEVTIYASGKICSMGIIVLVAGAHRFAGPNTRFMMHSASHSTEGKIKDTKSDVAEVEFQDNMSNKLLVARSKLSTKQLAELLDEPDHWFGVAQARKYGILTDTKLKKKAKPKPKKAKTK